MDETVSHRGLITVCVMLATIMQALDTTIANVALPYMMGSLSATLDQINWVLTSYIVAAAIAIPLTGFMVLRFGRKPVFVVAVTGFTIASVLCGLAASLDQMVLFRLLQGLFGAGAAYFLVGDRLSAVQIGASGVMLAAVLLLALAHREAKPEPAAAGGV